MVNSISKMPKPPFQVKKYSVGRTAGYFTLVDTRTNSIIDFADPEIQDADWLYSERNRLNTNWFSKKYGIY